MGLIWFLHSKSSSIFGRRMTIFFSPKSRLSLEITLLRIQQISEILCPWIKRPEAKTTVDSSTEWSILILCSHLRLRLLSGVFPSFFSPKTLYVFLSSPMRVTFSNHFVLFYFAILIMLWRSSHNEGFNMKIQIFWDMISCYLMRHFIMQNFPTSYNCVSLRSRHFPQHSVSEDVAYDFSKMLHTNKKPDSTVTIIAFYSN